MIVIKKPSIMIYEGDTIHVYDRTSGSRIATYYEEEVWPRAGSKQFFLASGVLTKHGNRYVAEIGKKVEDLDDFVQKVVQGTIK